MTNSCKKTAFRMLFLIAVPKLANKAVDLYKKGNIPVQYIFHAQGTASSEIMDTLGLSGEDKNILFSTLPKPFADHMLIKLQKKLHLGMPNSGIAFTIPLLSCSGRMVQLMENLPAEEKQTALGRYESEMIENEYAMIMAIVNQGFSEEVMDAARPMGASGGTVFHSRRIGNEEAMKFWGIRIQEEREVVLILVKKENKLPIMQAICQQCGMQSEAHGIVFSLPVDGIIGLN